MTREQYARGATAMYVLVIVAALAFIAWRWNTSQHERQHCVTTGGTIVMVHGSTPPFSDLWICDRR